MRFYKIVLVLLFLSVSLSQIQAQKSKIRKKKAAPSILGTSWVLLSGEKAGKPKQTVNMRFGLDWISYNPDCNNCTHNFRIDKRKQVLTFEDFHGCTQKGCKGAQAYPIIFERKASYTLKGDTLRLQTEKDVYTLLRSPK